MISQRYRSTGCLKKCDSCNDEGFNCRTCWGYRVNYKDTKNVKYVPRACLGTIGHVFCVPTVRPIAPIGPTIEVLIITRITLFFRHPVCVTREICYEQAQRCSTAFWSLPAHQSKADRTTKVASVSGTKEINIKEMKHFS